MDSKVSEMYYMFGRLIRDKSMHDIMLEKLKAWMKMFGGGLSKKKKPIRDIDGDSKVILLFDSGYGDSLSLSPHEERNLEKIDRIFADVRSRLGVSEGDVFLAEHMSMALNYSMDESMKKKLIDK
jgi:hypothetical protein